jgi:hypothetical protein
MKEAKTLIMDGLLLKCFVWLNVEPLFIFFFNRIYVTRNVLLVSKKNQNI